MNGTFVNLGGYRLHVVDEGPEDAEPVLFVHGYPLDHSMWRFQIESLSGPLRLIVPDLSGFGRSELNPRQQQASSDPGSIDGASIAEIADELAAMLEAMNIPQITFCGLSMGGYIGWEFFRRHRARVKRMIACSTRAIADTKQIARGRRMIANGFLRQNPGETSAAPAGMSATMIPKLFAAGTLQMQPGMVDSVRELIDSAAPVAIASALFAMAGRADSSSLLSDLDCPVLVVAGDEDGISTPDEMREFAARIENSQFETISGAGHLPPLENAAEFNRLIAAFVLSRS